MSEKRIVVHCPTQELWDKVCPGVDLPSSTWDFYKTESCIRLSTKTYADIDCYTNDYTIISAEDFLKEGENEVSEFKLGDRVKCVMDACYAAVTSGSIYTVTSVENKKMSLKGKPWGCYYEMEDFKLISSTIKTTKEETMNINDNVLEVFKEDAVLAGKVSKRFGSQYGTTDRDTIALKRDKKELLAIIKADEEEAAKDK